MSGFELEADRFMYLYDVKHPDELENCYVVINKFYAQFDRTNPYATVPAFVAAYPDSIPPSWEPVDFWHSAVLVVP